MEEKIKNIRRNLKPLLLKEFFFLLVFRRRGWGER